MRNVFHEWYTVIAEREVALSRMLVVDAYQAFLLEEDGDYLRTCASQNRQPYSEL